MLFFSVHMDLQTLQRVQSIWPPADHIHSCLLPPLSLGPTQAFLGLPYGESPTGLFSLMVHLPPAKGADVTFLNAPRPLLLALADS